MNYKAKRWLTLTFALPVLVGLLSIGPIYASSYSINSGWTVNLNDYTLNYPGDITNTGTLSQSTGTIGVTGNWTDTGTFNSGTGGTVSFTGTNTSTVTPTPVKTATPTPLVTSTPIPEVTPTPDKLIEPTAEFQADPIGGFEPLKVAFTDMSEGVPASWQWEFGDGDISAEQNPTHTYASAGNFNVSLKVCNSQGCDTEIKQNLIDVGSIGICNAAFNSDKTSGFVPLNVKFADKSTGKPSSWAWDFGDGDISSDQHPAHTYKSAGIFSVTLTISAACGTDILRLTNFINAIMIPAPVAEFMANPNTGFAPLEVQFTNVSTGDPTSFAWKFGDGGSSSDESPVHTYKSAGFFTVSLLVSNQSGADIETKTNLIIIQSGVPPVAEFQASPLTGFAPLKVEFTDKSEGNIANWVWSSGDGVTDTRQNHVHEYLSPGFYNVKLIISGEDGSGLENKVNLITILEGEGVTAAFTAEPLAGNLPFTVHFFDISSGEIANHTWEFGDGDTSTDKNPVHTYNTQGFFNVSLTVSGRNGTSFETKTGLIAVFTGKNPTAGFTVDESKAANSMLINKNGAITGIRMIMEDGDSGEFKVKFRDLSSSPDEDIVGREWNFGDGESSNEDEPEHTYVGKKGDTFDISLTVQNKEEFDTITKPAFVSITSSIIPGFIKGGVTDKTTKEAVSGVVIELGVADKIIVGVETTDDGLYFMQVPPGDYTISAKKDGFKESNREVGIQSGATESLDIVMEPGRGTPNPDETPEPGKVTKLKSSRKAVLKVIPATVVITAIDKNGDPVEGAEITTKVKSKGGNARVEPGAEVTDSNGEIIYTIQFSLSTVNGSVTFISGKAKTSVKMKKLNVKKPQPAQPAKGGKDGRL